jgi:peptide/nickel transport system ATP-binding protein
VVDRVAVMDAGGVVEEGEPDTLAERPSHPATRALVEASY